MLGVAHQVPPVVADPVDSAEQVGLLRRFAVVQRDALGVFAQADQAEAEVRLDALAIEVDRNQPTSNDVCQIAADDGVDQRDPDHVARDLDHRVAQRNG